MSTDSETVAPITAGLDPLQTGVFGAAVFVCCLYLFGLSTWQGALALAGPLTGLLAVAVTVLWIGERI